MIYVSCVLVQSLEDAQGVQSKANNEAEKGESSKEEERRRPKYIIYKHAVHP